MDTQLNASFAGQEKAKLPVFVRGHEKFAFLYVVITVVAIAWATTYSWIAGLAWWLAVPLVLGCVIAGCALIFTFLETRRLGQTAQERADEVLKLEADPYISRNVVVRPETGDAQVHHEFYPESQGLDQGQLTSQLSGTTPLVDRFLEGRRKKTA